MRSALVVVALVVCAGLGLGSIGAAQTVALLTIHHVTLHEGAGVLTITGIGFGREPVIAVDGQPVPVLPGGSETHLDVLAPAALLITPGSYRLTVMDSVRQVGDTFVVASRTAGVIAPVNVAPDGLRAPLDAAAAAPAGAPTTDAVNRAAPRPSPGAVSPHLIENGANTALGVGALASNTTGYYNAATGVNALNQNTTGFHNTAGGAWALYSNTTGNYNTASGQDALWSNTSGSWNTATGKAALYANTSGPINTATGYQALESNTTGAGNTAIGAGSLQYNTTGGGNTGSGSYALRHNTTGNYNTASGREALGSNTTGDYNTASGWNALLFNTTGDRNVALGFDAGFQATTGSYNVFLGADVTGTAADTNTIRIGLPYDSGTARGQNRTVIAGIYGAPLEGITRHVYVDASGRLGTVLPAPLRPTRCLGCEENREAPLVRGDTNVPLPLALLDQQAVIADLQARLARVEALLAPANGRK